MCAEGLGSRKKDRGLSRGQGFKGFQVEGTAPATECRDPRNEKTVVCEVLSAQYTSLLEGEIDSLIKFSPIRELHSSGQ